MEYPKPIMKLRELKDMGFPEEFLFRAYYANGQTFASKINPMKKSSPIFFDTAGFEKWRLQQIKLQNGGRL